MAVAQKERNPITVIEPEVEQPQEEVVSLLQLAEEMAIAYSLENTS